MYWLLLAQNCNGAVKQKTNKKEEWHGRFIE